MAEEYTKEILLQLVRALSKAVSMEQNAQNFYAQAAEKTKSPEGEKMFNWLSQFEEAHEKRLTSRVNALLNHPLLAGESIPDIGIFNVSETKDLEDVSKIKTEIDVLIIALQNEKRAYIFYQKKLTLARDEPTRQLFEDLSRDEEKHMKILDDQLHSLKMNKLYKDLEDFQE